ncbi:MAG TPA: ABC transporter permease [Pseudonocardiaceae bacterium]|nr:ABC transporter permease [Pseudonocardiaceae bacterium]
MRTGYLIRRLGTAILVLIGVVLVTFIMLHVIAPSPGRAALGLRATPEQVAAYNLANGYDRPLIVQFFSYLGQVVHGNLGWSYSLNQSVVSLLKEKAPLSAFLSGASTVLAILIAIPLGIYQAVKRNSVGDNVATAVAFTLYSMPVFLLGLILIDIFALSLGWVNANVGQDQSLSGALAHFTDLILPIVSLTAVAVASYSRYQRSAALDVMAQDYIKVARAKGLAERLVLTRHLVRNSALPMITLIGLSIPILLAGNLLIEGVFNINGLGLLFFKSLGSEDYNVLIGYTLVGAVLTVLGNLVADIALTAADPRIRLV